MLWPDNRWALTVAVLALAAVHLAAERMLPEKRWRRVCAWRAFCMPDWR